MLILSTPSYHKDIQDVNRPHPSTNNKRWYTICTRAIKWTETNMYRNEAKRNTSQINRWNIAFISL